MHVNCVNTLAIAFCLLIFSTAGLAADQQGQQLIENLTKFKFDKLGNPQIKTDSITPVLAGAKRPHQLLVISVEFADLGYDRFADDKRQDKKNRDYLQKLLFAGSIKKPKINTLSHYYRHQSKGQYHVTGTVLPVVQVDKPLSNYGRPVQNSDGSWRNDSNAEKLVSDALAVAYNQNPDFPWLGPYRLRWRRQPRRARWLSGSSGGRLCRQRPVVLSGSLQAQ